MKQYKHQSNSSYSEKLRDPRWQKKRLEIFERDSFACLDCGAKDKPLHVHHCHYEKGAPWETSDEFLMTLCEDCHDWRGAYEHDAKMILARILRRISAENEGLESFVQQMAWTGETLETCGGTPTMSILEDIEWDAKHRWRRYAEINPEFISAYEAVTGEAFEAFNKKAQEQ